MFAEKKVSFPILILLGQLLAFWSVWRWYWLRLGNSSDEIIGLIPIIIIAFFCFKFESRNGANNKVLILAIITTSIFAITYSFLPPMLRAVIAVTSLTLTISIWRFGKLFHVGIWTLFLLSLPIISSLQFYLGYPMRIIVGEATTLLLKINGLNVFREGVGIHFGEKLIWIDAPCSGIKMLWTGILLSAILVIIYRLNLAKSLIALAISTVIIFIGNIFRAVSLFYLEAEIIKMPEFTHSAIGVICFVLTCVGIVVLMQKFRAEKVEFVENNSTTNVSNSLICIFSIICLISVLYPVLLPSNTKTPITNSTTVFPNIFEDRYLKELELTEKEKVFLEDFPGEVKRFTDGEREIVIRYVNQATRKLHPSADCFTAIGYQIKPTALKIDTEQNRWSCFQASKNGEKLKVCERIYSESESWTDVSTWYWSALNDVNSTGYWAVTVAENEAN